MTKVYVKQDDFKTGRCIAQGDVRVWLKGYEPEELRSNDANLREVEAVDGQLIVTHSETGHHHAVKIRDNGAKLLIDTTNEFIKQLHVGEGDALEHFRHDDTHHTYVFQDGGIYVCRTDTEYTPEGLRRVAD